MPDSLMPQGSLGKTRGRRPRRHSGLSRSIRSNAESTCSRCESPNARTFLHPPDEFADHPCLRQWGSAYLPQEVFCLIVNE